VIDDVWYSMIDGTLEPSEASSLVADAARRIQDRLSDQPGLDVVAIQFLDASLRGVIDISTWDRIEEGLDTFFGANAAIFLAWIANGDVEDQVSQASASVSKATEQFLREVEGRFSAGLRSALTLNLGLPDDWTRINYWTFLEKVSGTFRIRVQWMKNDGNLIMLEMSPSSALRTMSFLTRAMLAIDRADVFEGATVEEYLSVADDLAAYLNRPGLDAQGGSPTTPSQDDVVVATATDGAEQG
jgi:hypothetical protein